MNSVYAIIFLNVIFDIKEIYARIFVQRMRDLFTLVIVKLIYKEILLWNG